MRIYMIMCCEQLEPTADNFPEFGRTSIMGYFQDKNRAFEAVIHNEEDIWETCYNYAIIEEVEEGIYPPTFERWFFKFNTEAKEYELIQEPKFLHRFRGLII